jgi:1-deoxy-D-xylulose-5-phosphate synthase
MLCELKKDHGIFVTLENGMIDGGFGQKVAGFLGRYGMKVFNFGARKEFVDRISVDEQKDRCCLRADGIIKEILALF